MGHGSISHKTMPGHTTKVAISRCLIGSPTSNVQLPSLKYLLRFHKPMKMLKLKQNLLGFGVSPDSKELSVL